MSRNTNDRGGPLPPQFEDEAAPMPNYGRVSDTPLPAPSVWGLGRSGTPMPAPRKLSRKALDNALQSAQSRLGLIREDKQNMTGLRERLITDLASAQMTLQRLERDIDDAEGECAQFASALENYKE